MCFAVQVEETLQRGLSWCFCIGTPQCFLKYLLLSFVTMMSDGDEIVVLSHLPERKLHFPFLTVVTLHTHARAYTRAHRARVFSVAQVEENGRANDGIWELGALKKPGFHPWLGWFHLFEAPPWKVLDCSQDSRSTQMATADTSEWVDTCTGSQSSSLSCSH